MNFLVHSNNVAKINPYYSAYKIMVVNNVNTEMQPPNRNPNVVDKIVNNSKTKGFTKGSDSDVVKVYFIVPNI